MIVSEGGTAVKVYSGNGYFYRNPALLFYGVKDIFFYSGLFLFSIAVNYMIGRQIGRSGSRKLLIMEMYLLYQTGNG